MTNMEIQTNGLRELLDALQDAAFACGEWTSDSDEAYEDVHQANVEARAAVDREIARLSTIQHST